MASVGYASPPPQSPPMAYIPMPHPYLREPLLHISGLPPHVADADLARAFETCVPFRPTIQRDGSLRPLSGTIEFKHLDKAEKALATLQSRQIPFVNPPAYLVLSPFPPTIPPQSLPPPLAHPRLVKHLPAGYTDSALYDLFRPFGPLASVRTQAGFGKDTGVVEFWREEDARRAEEAMHCAEVGDQNIAVQVYQPRRASGTVSDFSPSAPAFVPAGMPYQPHLQAYSPHSPPRVPLPYPQPRSPQIGIGQMPPFVHGPGQQVQFAPLVGPGSGSASGLIDPCNLFCKNLDPEIDSNGLFTHFRPFGQIVSARVMRNDNGQSRGFGFVSFQTPEQAAAAMHAMNGVLLGSKQIVVRLHEPKQLRQEKLAHRFASGGHNGHPRSASGATSPTASEGGESYTGWPGSVHGSGFSHPERGRRSSGSYYNAALTGKSNLPMRYDDLSALSPVVRKEVLTGELSRRVKDVDGVEPTEVEAVVEALVGLSLGEVLEGIQSPAKLAEQVRAAKDLLAVPTIGPISTSHSSPAASPDSRLLDATASAPEHPSTPVSFSASISTPPRTSSPSGSVAPSTSERDRLAAAVARLERKRADEITDLLLSLSHKERALCLFNKEYLKGKVAEARDVLEVLRSDDEPPREELPQRRSTAPPATPQSKTVLPSPEVTPQTPDLSSRGPSAAASPTSPATPSVSSSSGHTLASLARLPAVEIVKLANSPSATGLPLPKADPLVVKGTNEFIDSLAGKPVAQQKQQLGEKLFRVIKAFGIKGSPKITIALLDSEDLRALAHLMNSYPSVLKEKVLLATAAGIGSK